MKALFVGLGSIGTRHLKDFHHECIKRGITPELYALRRKVQNREELDRLDVRQMTELDDTQFDVIFITNPTCLHHDALNRCRGRGKFFFVEKPIFDQTGINPADLGLNKQNTYVAAPMRHTLTYKTLKSITDSKQVFSARVICSSYLPEWRPGIDYRTNYSAIREMGGGVPLDLIHEIDYVTDLFGLPKKAFCLRGRYSDLEITSDDLGVYIWEYEKLICEIHLDYFGRKYRRECEFFTKEGTFIADFGHEEIRCPDGRVIDCHVMANEEFVSEMKYFLDFVSGSGVIMNPPELAVKTLALTLGEQYA